MAHIKKYITTENNKIVEAVAPVIVSASRASDIPAFYGNSFINSLNKNYTVWKNPFNGKISYVSFENTRVFVFWTKNPEPFFKYLDILDQKNFKYYFQFTLNNYDSDIEPDLPPLQNRINSFISLSEKIGNRKVIWRFDPYILSRKYTVEELLLRTEKVAEKIAVFTQKLVFSFADIADYRKVKSRMKTTDYKEFEHSDKIKLAEGLQKLGEKYNLEIATCSEEISLERFGIKHNKCVDDELIMKLFGNDKNIYEYLIKSGGKKDKGQRKFCKCTESKDIGKYNTCLYSCKYCYARK